MTTLFYHLKIIIRTLSRNFTYSAINIAGLAIGITVCVFIFLWVHHERSYDRYHTGADHIYLVASTKFYHTSGTSINNTGASYRLTSDMKDYPGVEQVVAFCTWGLNTVRVNNETYSVFDNTRSQRVIYITSNWFEMFDYTLLEGSFEAFGAHPYSVALTRSEARRYFGNEPAVGQTISIKEVDHAVQAIIADPPTNSSFQWHVLINIESQHADPTNRRFSESYGLNYYDVFIKLRPDADIAAINQRISELATIPDLQTHTVSILPLRDVYFNTEAGNRTFYAKGNRDMVSLFSILGVLLLLSACINYVNLTTAKANTRTKEVGIKKVVGAKRSKLILQFIGESFMMSLISVALSLLIIGLLSPFYHFLVDNAIFSFTSPVLWSIIALTLLATTVLNGIYPALSFSSFRPMNFLKGVGLLSIKGSRLRQGLVVVQFTLSTVLLVMVFVVFAQVRYIRQKDLGFQKSQVIFIRPTNEAARLSITEPKLRAMADDLRSEPAIEHMAFGSNILSFGYTKNADWDGKAADFQPEINILNAGANYHKVYGLELMEGRWFEEGNAADQNSFILNEAAVRELGIRKPYIGQSFSLTNRHGAIIGIVKDYHYQSLHEAIRPVVIRNFTSTSTINIKSHASQEARAMEAIKAAWQIHFPDDVFDPEYIEYTVDRMYASDIKTSQLMQLFSILAILIAMLGLYGLSTFTIERRIREIGIRKILGARVSQIVQLLTKEFLTLMGIAMLIAFPLAYYWADKLLQDYAYRIRMGWWIFALSGAIILILTLLTVGRQAIKAATANPANAIKSE